MRSHSQQRRLWFEKLMAVIATLNLGLVLFDLTYISWRNFYLKINWPITQIYDLVKGIEPHRETEKYLVTFKRLEQQVSQTGLQSSQTKATLEELRRLSIEMIETNPFAVAGKSGTLETIKNRMRRHIGQESAKSSFAIFWSEEYLSRKGWKQEINFFDQEIVPLIKTNYFRHIGENGEFIDRFWMLDLPFVILFAMELLGRSIDVKRRHPDFSWLNAILWRWHDLFLLLPFWRLLRFISVLIRLDQAQLLNLQSVKQQVQRGIISNFAEELTEIVVVRVINQIQGSIDRGEFARWLMQQEKLRPYIDVNNVNEVEAIAGIFVQTIVYQVLPKIQPNIAAILHHHIEKTLNQSPIYQNLQMLPILGEMPTHLIEQLATNITENLYNVLVRALEDPVSAQLSNQLLESFSTALGTEIRKQHVLSEIQSLLVDFLEEVKLNYIRRLSEENIEQILAQTSKLRTQASVNSVIKNTYNPALPLRKKDN